MSFAHSREEPSVFDAGLLQRGEKPPPRSSTTIIYAMGRG